MPNQWVPFNNTNNMQAHSYQCASSLPRACGTNSFAPASFWCAGIFPMFAVVWSTPLCTLSGETTIPLPATALQKKLIRNCAAPRSGPQLDFRHFYPWCLVVDMEISMQLLFMSLVYIGLREDMIYCYLLLKCLPHTNPLSDPILQLERGLVR